MTRKTVIPDELKGFKAISILQRMVENPPSLVDDVFPVMPCCVCGCHAGFVRLVVKPKNIIDLDISYSFLCEVCFNGKKKG